MSTCALPPGITIEQTDRHKSYLVEVRVRPYPKRRKRFPLDTPIHILLTWRQAQIHELTDARRALDRAREATADPLAPKTAPAAVGTLRADVEHYIDHKMPAALKATQLQWPRYLRTAAAGDLGRLPRQMVTAVMWTQLLEQWIRYGIPATPGDHHRRRVVAPKPIAVDTARKIRTAWITFYDTMNVGLGLPNPARLVPRPADKGADPEPGGIPMKDALAIVDALPKGSRTAARLTLMATLGLRPAEIMRIQPARDWHRQARTLYVRTAKKGRPRTLPLCDRSVAALELLDSHPKGGWGMFTSAPAARMFHAAVLKAGMERYEPIVPYALRHTFATEAYRVSGDLKATSEAIGHKSLKMTERYVEAAVSAQVGSLFKKVAAAMPKPRLVPRKRGALREVK